MDITTEGGDGGEVGGGEGGGGEGGGGEGGGGRKRKNHRNHHGPKRRKLNLHNSAPRTLQVRTLYSCRFSVQL